MVACLVLANKGHSQSTFTRTKHQLKSTQPVVMTSRNEPFLRLREPVGSAFM